MPHHKYDLVGVDEIAQRLGVPRSTVSVWLSRGWPKESVVTRQRIHPPEPVGVISKRVKVFEWADIAAWARVTGYLDTDD